ncbi:hypothetical protein F5X96DRAFT_263651 [Biscogniauxia mediterranea]|nr:hypothetical protein F5X96DRAFT_263651 [Biscogniauxia mediterranea]
MKHIHGGSQDYGADTTQDGGDQEPQRGRVPTRVRLSTPLQIPKNRSTGNLSVVSELSDDGGSRPRYRFSYDTGSGAVEYDSVTRCVLVLLDGLGWRQNTATTGMGTRHGHEHGVSLYSTLLYLTPPVLLRITFLPSSAICPMPVSSHACTQPPPHTSPKPYPYRPVKSSHSPVQVQVQVQFQSDSR